MNRATSFAERLRLNLAVIHGEVKQDDNEDDGRNSPPPQEMEGEGLSMPPITRTPSKSGIPVFYYLVHDLEAVGCCQFLYQSGLILFIYSYCCAKGETADQRGGRCTWENRNHYCKNISCDLPLWSCDFLLPTKDDIVDEMDRLTAAANCLKEGGAYKIYAVATHGLLSKDACEQLENSALDEVSTCSCITGACILL